MSLNRRDGVVLLDSLRDDVLAELLREETERVLRR